MTMLPTAIAEVARRDPRYAPEAYEFVYEAIGHTQRMLDRTPAPDGESDPGPEHHVTGPELLAGVRDLALREFGRMARTVFHLWGIDRTDDFGAIIFNLIGAKVLSKTEHDRIEDFHAVYDLDKVLVEEFVIRPEEADWLKRGDQ